MQKINLGFNRFTEAVLLVIAQAILAALTGNAFFPTTTPTLAELQTAIDAYTAALSASMDGGKASIAAKNARKQDLIELLVALGNYVMLTARGNVEMLASTGFPLTKERQPQPPLDTPKILKLESGTNTGELTATIAALKGALTYVYQYTQDPLSESSEWISQNSTLSKITFTGLEAGKKYWVRVIAYGRNEQELMSDPVLSRLIQ